MYTPQATELNLLHSLVHIEMLLLVIAGSPQMTNPIEIIL